jgi:hypothetical protein
LFAGPNSYRTFKVEIMQTVRQIERLWTARQYPRLFRELVANRPEASFDIDLEPAGSTAAAAMGIIRLHELDQSHVSLYSTLIRALVASQDKDGGWQDATLSALCLRALMLGRETAGAAIDRGLAYLAPLQRADGLWPKIPLRRMPGDACVSAFVLHQLGDEQRFRAAVRFDDAVDWFASNTSALDTSAKKLWDRASLRCRARRVREPMLMWS